MKPLCRSLSAFAILVIALCAFCAIHTIAAPAPRSSLARSVDDANAHRFLCLVNSARSQRGLRPVVLSAKLTNAATEHSHYQASRSDMTHADTIYGPLQQRILRLGLDFTSIAENIAVGAVHAVDQIFNSFMRDQAHYRNIMDPNVSAMGL
ncbi:hypothetical protein EV182_007619, partial [Spiromyces aspiralis]